MADPWKSVSPNPVAPVARAAKRRSVLQQGRIVLGPERLIACTVRDVSSRGARLRVARRHDLPDTFSLVIAAHDLRTVPARLCWRREDCVGVAFEDGPAPYPQADGRAVEGTGRDGAALPRLIAS